MCTKQSLHGQKFSLKLIFINKKRKENVSLKHLSRISVTDRTALILANNILFKVNMKTSKFGQIYRTYISEISWNFFRKIAFKELKNYKGKDELVLF